MPNLLSTHYFYVKSVDEDDDLPGLPVHQELMEPMLSDLIDADAVCVPYQQVTLQLDYPLRQPVDFALETSEDGFSRRQLAQLISEHYHTIYGDEKKYAVYGHVLEDLDLMCIHIYQDKDGITLKTTIDS
jgi:hypothetical protein